MKRHLVRLRRSKIHKFFTRHKKYAPVVFFIGGFIFDTLTLGRIDRLYDLIVLNLHMISLTIVLYLYNLADDGKWKNTFLERYEIYFPLAIQFFFGGLSSAFVIYFSRSVSLSKTISFFVLLLALLFANEFLKKRISNKYLQFSVYFFVNFTFCTFMIPVLTKEMNTTVFFISGMVSLFITLILVIFIYQSSPSTRLELNRFKIISIIVTMYVSFNLFYIFNLIPPVPLALDSGIVAHNVQKTNSRYLVTYEAEEWYIFWRNHKHKFMFNPGEKVYVFSSIFAPTDIKKGIAHRWQWFNPDTEEWEKTEDIDFDITGGRNEGYRAYTYKSNLKYGLWKVEIITEEELVIGVVDFEIIASDPNQKRKLVTRKK
ncbi:DUF2914 domain-containing protein [Psychroserpens sp. Hel_I_66]|uniref:DUF2914 domain-containing protein n=1 Tax=Psychroserpens sp. Hel_I_66 TaxID=1250004 RepID=UPI000648738A|nr:DUF2914 domain-containing protein [Psychroserpens sp. Hel_I_66]